MKRELRFVLLITVGIAMGASLARATEEEEETLGDKLKKLFVHHPTPTPKPHRKRRTSAAPVKSPSSETPASPSATAAPEQVGESPSPSTTVEIQATTTPTNESQTQYFEAVRPITPHPGSRRSAAPKTAPATQATPFPTMTVTSEPPTEIPESRPMPSLPELTSSTPSKTPETSPTMTPPALPVPKKSSSGAISIDEISESSSYSPEVRKIVDLGLELTGRNLTYKYASADPTKGGMDCSGFIYYVLTESDVENVPRDAREQYIWVRKAGNFQAVLAQRDDSFELDQLKPGDLLFWASNYGVSRDPDITQTMIYLGREKGTNQRLMVGASESRSSKGQKKPGVGVFEFKVGHVPPKPGEETAPVFVGYGRIPGVSGK